MMTNNDIELPGIGIFGTGLTARAIIYLFQSQGFQVEALWGKVEDDANKLATELKIPFYTCHIDDVLLNPKVKLVCIKCPPFLQLQISLKTLRIGKMVICDSPAGLNFKDAKSVLDAAQYYPSLLSLISFYFRFLPTFMEMKNKINEGYVGDIQVIEVRVHCFLSIDVHFNWFHDHRIGGGFLTNFGTHFIDIISFITGQRAKKVHGMLKTYQKKTDKVLGFREITSDDYCSFRMLMENDICCECILNNNVRGKFKYEIHVQGTNAYLRAEDGYLYGQSCSDQDINEDLLEEDPHEIPKGLESVFPKEIAKQLPIPFCVGMAKFVESLKKAFNKKSTDRVTWHEGELQPAATFEDTLYVHSVLESIFKSSRSSVWEQVENIPQDNTDTKNRHSANLIIP